MTSTTAYGRISEHQEQATFFSEVRFRYQSRDDFARMLLFSVPNGMQAGGPNKYALINKFKAEGMVVGVADILYLQPRGDYNCLAIEMKAVDRRNDSHAVSPEQAEFLAAINGAGGLGEVCFGHQEAVKIFDFYMSLPVRE